MYLTSFLISASPFIPHPSQISFSTTPISIVLLLTLGVFSKGGLGWPLTNCDTLRERGRENGGEERKETGREEEEGKSSGVWIVPFNFYHIIYR